MAKVERGEFLLPENIRDNPLTISKLLLAISKSELQALIILQP
jgi:hypothetical protein